MINRINHKIEENAEAIQKLQKKAYQIEAEMIGFYGIPQLSESVEEIQRSDEIFIGYMEEGLKGFVSYKAVNGIIDIHRLAVSPDHLRKGIAKRLLEFLLLEYNGLDITVSTGFANIPARRLYESFGFQKENKFQVAPGIYCICYHKNHRK